MQSLTTKLVLSMWIISVITIAMVITLATWSFRQGENDIQDRIRINLLIADLIACYDQFGRWPRDSRRCQIERSSRGIVWRIVDEKGALVARMRPNNQQPLANQRAMVMNDQTFYFHYRMENVNNRPPAPIFPLSRADLRPNEAMAPFTVLQQTLLWGGALTTMISLLAGWLVARTITKPVRDLTAATYAIAQGDLSYHVNVKTDDELGKLGESFNQMSSDLARSEQLRTQMTADIAHDLRTPVSIIMGHAEAIKDGVLLADETIHIIHDEAMRLNHLIEDLRTLTLADAGELTLTRCPTLINPLLQRVQSAHLPQAISQHIDLIICLAPASSTVDVDSDRIIQALNNLIKNALRYTPTNGKISLEAQEEGNQLMIMVSDTGDGIAPHQLPHIFDRFYRADVSRHGANSGLGLAIVKSIVEQHSGTISVTSILGEGSTFAIALPLNS